MARALATWFNDVFAPLLVEVACACFDMCVRDWVRVAQTRVSLPCVPLGHVTELLSAMLWSRAYELCVSAAPTSSESAMVTFLQRALLSHCVDVEDALACALLR
jgi:hypothetical protein